MELIFLWTLKKYINYHNCPFYYCCQVFYFWIGYETNNTVLSYLLYTVGCLLNKPREEKEDYTLYVFFYLPFSIFFMSSCKSIICRPGITSLQPEELYLTFMVESVYFKKLF